MQSHEFSRNPLFLSVLQASQDCIRLLDLDGCVQFMNEAGKALLEIDESGFTRHYPGLWVMER